MSNRTHRQLHPVARSLRLRAVAREREVDKAWAVLERHGFRPEMVGLAMPSRQLRGRLPDAVGRALRCLSRERDRARRQTAKLEARLKAAFPGERRYDRFGEIRMLATIGSDVVLRWPGRAVAVCSRREWDAMSREPVK